MKRLPATAALVSALSITCVNLAAAQEPYLGEVRLFGFNFCPVGWLAATGQTLPISQHTALFSLYGTFYGGNGTSTFALPNLSGRAPYGQASGGVGQPIGAAYGASTHTLTSRPNAHAYASACGKLSSRHHKFTGRRPTSHVSRGRPHLRGERLARQYADGGERYRYSRRQPAGSHPEPRPFA